MQNVKIICIGKLKEKYFTSACEEYAKRLRAFCKFSIVELPESRLPDSPSEAEIEKALLSEAEKILSAAQGSTIIAMCIEGTLVSSEKLSDMFSKIALSGKSDISIIIGSSFGLSDKVKKAADYRISMSPMTFPHQLARVMLCEQIYRAYQIQSGGKYHK